MLLGHRLSSVVARQKESPIQFMEDEAVNHLPPTLSRKYRTRVQRARFTGRQVRGMYWDEAGHLNRPSLEPQVALKNDDL